MSKIKKPAGNLEAADPEGPPDIEVFKAMNELVRPLTQEHRIRLFAAAIVLFDIENEVYRRIKPRRFE